MHLYRAKLKPLARQLRRNMTDAEQLLWHHLRRKQMLGIQFYRQKPIGPYIVDFYVPVARLIIELDGGHHFTPQALAADTLRSRALENLGLAILRFDNLQILRQTDAVLQSVHDALRTRR